MSEASTEEESTSAPRWRPSALVLIAIILAIVALDQATKHWARLRLQGSEPRLYAGGVVMLTYAENTGAFLSLGANLPRVVRRVVFDLMVSIALLIGAYFLFARKIRTPRDEIVFALVLGGGIGNMIDRLFRDGRVTDFIYLQAGPLHTGVFNIADIAVTGAVIFLLLASYFLEPKKSAPIASG